MAFGRFYILRALDSAVQNSFFPMISTRRSRPFSCPRWSGNRYCVSFERAALNELVAQLVEQRPFKAWVLGSSPSELTTHSEWFSPSLGRFPVPAIYP